MEIYNVEIKILTFRFLGRKGFFDRLGILNLLCNVSVVDFDASLTSVMIDFYQFTILSQVKSM